MTWGVHLYTATRSLRGFFGDGALAFLVYLSNSYVFNKPGHWIHLFPVGFPRDFQMLLNALGLQVALWLNIHDPDTLKYIFVFWQFALPGFLYLGLFACLWRTRNLSWAVFPLIAWAVLSISVEWSAPNSTRWAMPLFWSHFLLVTLSGPKIRPWSAVAAVTLGAAMLGGLYESVMLHCALCLGLGILFWMRQKDYVPFLYASAAIPGAIRAFLTYLDTGHSAPNGFSGLTLPLAIFSHPYFFFIVFTLGIIVVLGLTRLKLRYVVILVFLMLWAAIRLWLASPPNVWTEIGIRFDYVFISLALMAWAGCLRLRGDKEVACAPALALIALLAGSVLWVSQIQETTGWWRYCRATHAADMHGQTLNIAAEFRPMFANDRPVVSLPNRGCIWDWAQPWADLLFAEKGQVESWSILTFWQDFSFIRKDGEIYFHTNNWTLNSTAMLESSADLPLKTLLYDLTPLYQKLGDGPLATRIRCIPPQYTGDYWRNYLSSLDNNKRQEMFVCPAQ